MALSDHLVSVRPIKTAAEYDSIVTAATENGHGVLYATHIITKKGETVGYFSVGAFTTVWLHSDKVTPRDTSTLLVGLDALAAQIGLPNYTMICEETSPFYKVLPALGFTKNVGQGQLMMKNLQETK